MCSSSKIGDTLLIGHRGFGAGKVGIFKENTVSAIEAAYSLGFRFVEFDVQITHDGHPVLYHDWCVSETGMPTTVPSLELKRICSLRSSQVVTHSIEWHGFFEKTNVIDEPIPTLLQVLKSLPKNLGFNIEIKHPMEEEIAEIEKEMNCFIKWRNCAEAVQCILDVVLKEIGTREVIFSSFNHNICRLVKEKASSQKVFLITSSSDESRNQFDTDFILNFKLDGIVCESSILKHTSLIEKIKNHKLMLFTYGSEKNDLRWIEKQIEMGIDGIIIDDLIKVSRHFNLNLRASLLSP